MSAEMEAGSAKTQGKIGDRRGIGPGGVEPGAAATTRVEAGGQRKGEAKTGGTEGTAERAKMDEKEIGGANGRDVVWTVRWRNPREVSLVAAARTGVGGARARIEVAEEGGRPQRLAARLQEALAGSNGQHFGRLKEAAARVMGKSR